MLPLDANRGAVQCRTFRLTEAQARKWFEQQLPKADHHLFSTVFGTCLARAYPFQPALAVRARDSLI